MVTITPAPEHKVTLTDNTHYMEITCPYCAEKQTFPDEGTILFGLAVHKCAKKNIVHFLNGYAFTGVGDFLAAEAASRRPGGSLG